MRTLLLGGGGQLASEVLRLWPPESVLALGHAALDVTDREAVRSTVLRLRPQLVINTAAYHRVDECEERVEEAFRVNAYGAKNVADACREGGAALVFISTDYVFSGDKGAPYAEEDPVGPVNVYGVSKVAGEQLVRYACPRHFIVRSSGLYGVAGASGKGGNFVETMLRRAREGQPIRVVADQVLSPTSAADLAAKLYELTQTGRYGTYHVTNGGWCSWYEFAGAIFEEAGLRPALSPTTAAEFGAAARRPAFSALENGALRRLGLAPLRPWREALVDYLRAKGHVG